MSQLETLAPDAPATHVRAIVLPILKPLAPSGDWPALRADLNAMFAACRRAANIVVSAIYTKDMADFAAAAPGEFPRAAWPQTYHLAKAACPELPTKIVSAVDHFVRLRYSGKNSEGQRVRIACMMGRQSVPNFTSVAIPIPACQLGGGYVLEDRGGDLLVSLPLLRTPKPGAKGKLHERGTISRWSVQIKTLDKHGKPRLGAVTLRRAISEGWKLGECRVFERGRHVRIAIAAHLPAMQPRDAKGEMRVVTGAESLIETYPPGCDKPWLYHGNQLRELIAVERRAQQRLRDDYKFEPRRERNGPRDVMARRARRSRNRVGEELHKISAMLVAKAQRANAAEISYDDRERGWLGGSGPYADLATKIEQKAEAAGIIFRRAADDK